MSWCGKCGNEIPEGSKFCPNCGTSAELANSSSTIMKEETVYEGKIHVCPHCGYKMQSFSAFCPACGSEIRDARSSESVREFANKLEKSVADQNKTVSLIRSFPIPNTKEDIFEFMILASTNISGEDRKPIFDAWIIKMEQCYQKAKLTFGNDEAFSSIQKIYDDTNKKLNKLKLANGLKTTKNVISKTNDMIGMILRNALIVFAIILYIMSIHIDSSGGNSSMHELIGALILMISAGILAKRNAPYIDFVIVGIGGGLSIFLARFLDNGSMLELGGGITIILVVVNFFKVQIKRGKNTDTNNTL